MSVMWGKLAADTLTQNYEAATDDLLRLRESLDNQSFATPLMQLQQRTWLMHWSLHVFWNTENGKNALIDLFLQPAYMSAIQINAQHLLRYLAAAVVVNRKRRNVLRELIKVIQQESYEYSDPITQVRRLSSYIHTSSLLATFLVIVMQRCDCSTPVLDCAFACDLSGRVAHIVRDSGGGCSGCALSLLLPLPFHGALATLITSHTCLLVYCCIALVYRCAAVPRVPVCALRF
jgi:hypothetical protein